MSVAIIPCARASSASAGQASASRPPGVPMVRVPLVGLVCLLASASYLLGGPGAALIGPGIALLAIVSVGIAAAYAREGLVTS